MFGRAGVKSIINPLHNTVNQEMLSVSRLFGKMFSSVFSFTDSYEPVNFFLLLLLLLFFFFFFLFLIKILVWCLNLENYFLFRKTEKFTKAILDLDWGKSGLLHHRPQFSNFSVPLFDLSVVMATTRFREQFAPGQDIPLVIF